MTIDVTPLVESAPNAHVDRVRGGLGRGRSPFQLAGPVLLIAPAIGFLAVFFLYPLVGLALRSLNVDGDAVWSPGGLTWSNYADVFDDPTYWVILKITLQLAVVATAVTTAIAYPVAYFIRHAPPRLGRLVLIAVVFPYLTSILIRLFAFTQILDVVGLHRTTTGAIIGMVAYLLPFVILLLYSAMVAVDTGLGPAARTLGATPWRVFTSVFFPNSRRGLVAAALFAFVVSLGFYITPAVLGSTSNLTMSVYIQQRVTLYQWGVASAMGMALLVATMVIYALSNRAAPLSAAAALTGNGKGTAREQTFRWTGGNVALGGWTLVVLAFLMLPLVVVVILSFGGRTYLEFPPSSFSLRWYRELLDDRSWFDAAWLSVRLGIVSAVVSTALGLAAALGLDRMRARRFSGVLRAVIFVPVVRVGAGLFGLLVRLKLNDEFSGYVIGHVVMSLPITVMVSSLALHPGLRANERAARTLGAGPWRAFWSVTFPAIAPTIAGAFVAAFLTSWDEAVVTMFLTRTEVTLPVKYFLYLREQLLPTMAAVGTVLVALTLLGFVAVGLVVKALRRRMRTPLTEVSS